MEVLKTLLMKLAAILRCQRSFPYQKKKTLLMNSNHVILLSLLLKIFDRTYCVHEEYMRALVGGAGNNVIVLLFHLLSISSGTKCLFRPKYITEGLTNL